MSTKMDNLRFWKVADNIFYWAKTLNNTKFEIIGSKGLNLHLSIRIRLWINILTQLYLNWNYFNRPVESKANIQSISTESKKIDNYTLNSLVVKENSILLNKIQISSITKHIQDDLCLNVKGTNIKIIKRKCNNLLCMFLMKFRSFSTRFKQRVALYLI